MNAVLAKLHAKINIKKLDLRGTFALVDVLEHQHDTDTMDYLLPAAAVWVIFAGKALKCNGLEYAQYDSDDGSGRLP